MAAHFQKYSATFFIAALSKLVIRQSSGSLRLFPTNRQIYTLLCFLAQAVQLGAAIKTDLFIRHNITEPVYSPDSLISNLRLAKIVELPSSRTLRFLQKRRDRRLEVKE